MQFTRAPFETADAPAGRRILVLAHDAAAATRLRALLCDAKIAAIATGMIGDDAGEDGFALLYIDLSDATDDVLSEGVAQAQAAAMPVLVEFAPAQIDAVAGSLVGSSAVLLCEPGSAERMAAIALALAASGSGSRVGERSRDAADERLRRLNEEVSRIAETLARLTQEDQARTSLGDRTTGYGPAPTAPPAANRSSAHVRAVLRARRLRDQFFGSDLFADPAWDMLLDLYAAHLEDAQVSVSSLCIAAAVPPTTALRWIQTMHERGLFDRTEDPSDRRRAFISLSDDARDTMERYFRAVEEMRSLRV